METASLLFRLFRFALRGYYQNAFEYFISLAPSVALLTDKSSSETGDSEPPVPLGLSPSNITVEWLTHLLQKKELLSKDNRIRSFELSTFGEVGQMSELYRMTLSTAKESTLTPSSLIVKCNDRSIKGRVVGSLTLVHETEHGFFRDFSEEAQSVIPHPKVYFQAYDAATDNGLLIMEEIRNVRHQKLGVTMSVSQTKSHLSQIAALHAQYWQDPKLMSFDWLVNNSARREQTWGTMMKLMWKSKGKPRLVSIMSPKNIDTIEMFVQNSDKWCKKIDSCTYTLLHGDMNPYNLLIPKEDSDNQNIVTVDWQTVIRGNWSQDVAYFFASNLNPSTRKAHDDELLEHYRCELVKRGIDLSPEQLASDIVLGNIYVLVFFVMSFSVLEPSDPTQLEIMNYFTECVTYILDKDDSVRHMLESLL